MPQPVNLESGQEFTFTIKRGVGNSDCVSVNYDDFVNDVEAGDMLLVDGMLKISKQLLYEKNKNYIFIYLFLTIITLAYF